MTAEFSLKYRQPFTLAEAIEFDVSVLTREISRLVNSISRLKDTNQELQSFVDDPETADDAEEYLEIVKENEEVIGSQEERIRLIKLALERKLGFDPANKHYDEAVANSPSNRPIAASTAPEDGPSEAVEGSIRAPSNGSLADSGVVEETGVVGGLEEEDGLHL